MSFLLRQISHDFSANCLRVIAVNTDLSLLEQSNTRPITFEFGQHGLTTEWTVDDVSQAVAMHYDVAPSFVVLALDDAQPPITQP